MHYVATNYTLANCELAAELQYTHARTSKMRQQSALCGGGLLTKVGVMSFL